MVLTGQSRKYDIKMVEMNYSEIDITLYINAVKRMLRRERKEYRRNRQKYRQLGPREVTRPKRRLQTTKKPKFKND